MLQTFRFWAILKSTLETINSSSKKSSISGYLIPNWFASSFFLFISSYCWLLIMLFGFLILALIIAFFLSAACCEFQFAVDMFWYKQCMSWLDCYILCWISLSNFAPQTLVSFPLHNPLIFLPILFALG